MELNKLLRNNIKALKPYSSARDEFSGEADVYLDANENPFNAPYNRYPDPLQWAVKTKIAALKNIAAEKIFSGAMLLSAAIFVLTAHCKGSG